MLVSNFFEEIMYLYDDLSMFAKVVECKSFSLAAKLHQVSQPTIKRHIRNLEANLGNDLVQSSVNKITITTFGNEVYAKWKEKEQELQRLLDKLKPDQTQLEGELKVTLPNSLSHYLITPRLPQFLQRYPRLKLILDFNQNEPNLLASDYNVAVSTIYPSQQPLLVRPIFNSRCGLYCSKEYAKAYGLPSDFNQLQSHHQVAYLDLNLDQELNFIIFKHKATQEEIHVNKASSLSLNSIDNIVVLLNSNNYIIGLEEYEYQARFKNSGIIPVLPEFFYQELKYYLVLPSRIKDHKSTIFCNFIKECIEQFPLI